MKFKSLLCVVIALCCSGLRAEHPIKPQTALEFCNLYPTHPQSILLKKIFTEVKPRSKISKFWRTFVTGEGLFLPNDHLRHYFYLCVKDMAKELNWDKQKIHQEVAALEIEVQRIRNA